MYIQFVKRTLRQYLGWLIFADKIFKCRLSNFDFNYVVPKFFSFFSFATVKKVGQQRQLCLVPVAAYYMGVYMGPTPVNILSKAI